MAIRLCAMFLFLSATWIATSVHSAESQSESPVKDIKARRLDALKENHKRRHELAMVEYKIRLSEFQSGRTPVNLVLQANMNLLHASLAADVSESAIAYGRRASKIESIATTGYERGTVTIQEVEQAKSYRLDALLKRRFSDADLKNL